MARLSTDKLNALKKAFTEDAISPGQAAQAAAVTYATIEEILHQLLPSGYVRYLESKIAQYK